MSMMYRYALADLVDNFPLY